MFWFNNLGFRWKLLLPIMLLAGILLILALVSARQISNLSHAAFELGDQYVPGLNYLLQADRDMQQALVAERSLIFLDTKSEKFHAMSQSHKDNINQTHERVSKFFEIVKDEDMQARRQTFFDLFDNWKTVSTEVKRHRTEGGRKGRTAAIELSFNEANKQFETARNLLDELSEQLIESANADAQNAHKTSGESYLALGLTLGTGLITCLLVAVLFPGLVTRPLNRVINTIDDLASGNGNLTLRLEVNSQDELATLASKLNLFLDKLHGLISKLANASKEVQASSQNLLDLNDQTQKLVTTQHTSTDMVATAMNQMSATVRDVAQSASNAAQAARQADADASNGSDLVKSSTESIVNLAQDVERAAEVIHKLETEVESVGSVLDVIRGIAEQTNLLALNAAIEAARAGEQGRGFAVVADEVRTLASRTKESTQEIQKMIESLQQGARNAVSVMNSGQENTKISVQRAESAGASLVEITSAVASISDMNIQIANAAEEQSAVTEDVNKNITEISVVADNTAQISTQASQASTELSAQAEELDLIVKNFTI
jgi:methyl-accepting chemotaxis protein